MKTPHLSPLTLFLAGTTAALLLVFGLQELTGGGHIQESLTQVGQELLPEAFAGFGTNTISVNALYGGYSSWPSSQTLKSEDTTAQTIDIMMYSAGSQYVILTDINGDGLVDSIFRQPISGGFRYGVFLNDGALGSNWAYKCVMTNNNYYGDCAG